MVLVASRKLGGNLQLQLPLQKLDYSFSNAQIHRQDHGHGGRELSQFEKLCVLGRGNYGVVHKVINTKTSSIYALKTIQDNSSSIVSQEVQILKSTNSPYLVKFYDVFGEKAILMEYMEKGSLDNIVRNIGALSETLIMNITKQVLNGLNYLHRNNIVHLDIKPSNLLVNNKMEVKIGDFGVSKIVNDTDTDYDMSSSCQLGTYAYMSPERLDSQTFRASSNNVYVGDVWSLGVSLWELYVGYFPFFPADSKPPSWMDIVLVVCCGELPSFPKTASDDFVSFLKCCLEREATKRWTVSQLLQHPFVCN